MSAQLSIPEPETTALVVPQKSTIATVVGADKDDILGMLAAKIAGFKADVTTNKGREEIASMGRAVSSSKVTLLKLADTLTEDAKKLTRSVAAEKKIIEDRMDTLRDNVLQPLVDYRNIEKDRVAAHEKALADIVEAPNYGQTETADEFAARVVHLRNYPPRDWQEFSGKAAQVLAEEIARAEALHEAAVKREADAAELARLQEQEAERARLAAIAAQEARERQIAQEAAEQAKRETERVAEQLRVAAEQKAEAERQASQRREQEAREATERAEKQVRQAEADKFAAEERAREREAELARKAEEQAIEAVAAEQRRAAAAIAQAEAEAAKRAANVAHKTNINREVLADLMKAVPGLAEGDAIEAVKAIARGLVRHVGVAY